MPVTSNRRITITWTNDVEYSQEFDAPVNPIGSGQIDIVNLVTGANTITVPANATAVTIIPPANNGVAMILKGVTGDTGIALSLIGQTSIGLLSVSTFVINAANTLTGLRLIYS